MASNILTAFNDHFVDFISDIQSVFPEDHDILVAKNALLAIRKANPKMIIKIWNTLIVGKYKNEIEAGNLTFFMFVHLMLYFGVTVYFYCKRIWL